MGHGAEKDAWRKRLGAALVARGDVYAVVGDLLAEAWDEGLSAGLRSDIGSETQPPNPYRVAQVAPSRVPGEDA